MYVVSVLRVDPTPEAPEKGKGLSGLLGKVIKRIADGLIDPQEVRKDTFNEAFNLLTLLSVFDTLGVDNIIRLSKDNFDYFYDREGLKNDVKWVLENFRKTNDEYTGNFDDISMVLEGDAGDLRHLILFKVHRVFRPGAYPIQVQINTVNRNVEFRAGETMEDYAARLKPLFAAQEDYEVHAAGTLAGAERFVSAAKTWFTAALDTENIQTASKVCVIRPDRPLFNVNKPVKLDCSKRVPLFGGYVGYDNSLRAALHWGDLMAANNIYCHDCRLVDQAGAPIMDVDAGFYAGGTNTLRSDAPFEVPEAGELTFFRGSRFQAELEKAGVRFAEEDACDERGRMFDFVEPEDYPEFISDIGDF